MAMGLPVVATNEGGIPEVVEDAITGSLVPSKNPALLADAIIDLLLDPEKLKQMGERGRQRAFRRFHPKEFAEKHEKLYKELYTKKLNKIRFRYKNRLRINNC
jgi:glycosyltransferase involved in cell wall biosynthesis